MHKVSSKKKKRISQGSATPAVWSSSRMFAAASEDDIILTAFFGVGSHYDCAGHSHCCPEYNRRDQDHSTYLLYLYYLDHFCMTSFIRGAAYGISTRNPLTMRLIFYGRPRRQLLIPQLTNQLLPSRPSLPVAPLRCKLLPSPLPLARARIRPILPMPKEYQRRKRAVFRRERLLVLP